MRLRCVLVAALVLVPLDSMAAQSSFSSVRWARSPNMGQWHRYSGARLYSENDRDFRFRAFGCEFEVQYPFRGSVLEDSAFSMIVRFMRDPGSGLAEAGLRPEIAARLVNGRVARIGSERPDWISCETDGTMTMFLVLAPTRPPRGRKVALAVMLQATTRPSPRGPIPNNYAQGAIPGVVFQMSEDFFTPNQARQAGSFALLLFRAWVERR